MIKNITDYKVIYICPDHNPKYNQRKKYMDEMLKKLGFKQIEHYKSGYQNYPHCLLEATIDILKNNLDEPFLLLEDDVEFTGINEVFIEDNMDAVYLGISRWGGHPTQNVWCGGSQFERYNDTQVKVINCLTTHAILYLSRSYKEAIINLFKNLPKNKRLIYHNIPIQNSHRFLKQIRYGKVVQEIEVEENWNTDVLISRIQKDYNVIANKKPSFYQSNKFNSSDLEASTKFEIQI